MGIEFEDVTDSPRSEADIRGALRVIEVRMVRLNQGMEDPELYLQYGTIRDALRELLGLRQLVERARAKG